MSTYSDDGYTHNPKATITVEEAPRSAQVTYRNAEGAKFRVLVTQKPNPVGFHVRLPGDKRR